MDCSSLATGDAVKLGQDFEVFDGLPEDTKEQNIE